MSRSRLKAQLRPIGIIGVSLALAAAALTVAGAAAQETPVAEDVLADNRSLDGSGNNLDAPTTGQAGFTYPRVAAANYADGVGEMVEGPEVRYVSNRVFNDTAQNVFSAGGVSHWAFVWGQFVDHTIGLRDSVSDEEADLTFDPADPLEEFTNDLGAIAFTRSAVSDGTGTDAPREQVNLVSSYIDAWAVYGGSDERLDWLREGPLDGDPTNNDATMMTDDGYLPAVTARGNVDEAPSMDIDGRLRLDPTAAVVTGDVRANENLGLTAVQTLFVREHNRIVAALPDDLTEEEKFQIARRVIAAEQQWITYNEFLPAMGVELNSYRGYDPEVDPSITNEFATVGYRAHSMIHGEFEVAGEPGTWSASELAQFEDAGIEVGEEDGEITLAIPLNVAFFNPDLLPELGLGRVLAGLGSEAEYANDEQIDNQLRSVLFQIPGADTADPAECLDGSNLADCFSGVIDLGAIDVARGRDHGMPSYNDLRIAYGLDPVISFTDITGEATTEFPLDPLIDQVAPIDDPDILDFVELLDGDDNIVEPGSEAADAAVVTATRRTTLAARLQAIYGTVDEVDAFVGMVSEEQVPGAEMGELQLAMWTAQFAALRDGDRFFYGNDALLDVINDEYGLDYRRTLAQVIADNSDGTEIQSDAFIIAPEGDEGDDGATGQAAGEGNDEDNVQADDRRRLSGRRGGDHRPHRHGHGPEPGPGD
jgi:hypothetical protein